MRVFHAWEFDCHCKRGVVCDADPMQPEFLAKLDGLSKEWGKHLDLTSARRCRMHNKKVGGAQMSQHIFGNACDFMFPNSEQARKFAFLAEIHNFKGIGLGQHLVHIDNRKTKARWFYV